MLRTVYLGLGSNRGRRKVYLSKAKSALDSELGTCISSSGLYETAAWGKKDQPTFINQVIAYQTNKAAEEILALALTIELKMGRRRLIRWGPRKIDIDLLLLGEEIISSPDLVIPHPSLEDRKFVLAPLAEIAGEVIHPISKKNIKKLLEDCEDELMVTKLA